MTPRYPLAIAWWLVIGTQLLAAAYAFHVAKLYDFVYTSRLVQFLYSRPEPFMRAFIIVQYTTMGGHALSAAAATTKKLSQWKRQRHQARIGPTQVQEVSRNDLTEPATVSGQRNWFYCCLSRGFRLLQAYVRVVRRFWSRHSVELMQLRTTIEVALQTAQATQLSQLVASVWINRFFALSLVANCWFVPVVHATMGRYSRATVELTQSIVDASLDMTYAMIFPLVIFFPCFRQFNQHLGSFPWEFFYLDTWYVGAVTEMRHVLVTSWTDFLGKAAPSLSLVIRLFQIQRFLSTINHSAPPRSVGLRSHVSRSSVSMDTKLRVRYVPSRLSVVLNAVLLCWGVVVLGLHIHVSVLAWRHEDSGCLRELRPWGNPLHTCAVFEVNCESRGVVGNALEMENALRRFDAHAVHSLIISHCPALEMPRRLADFSSLTVLKIYNTTIAEWDESAALTHTAHPLLQSVFLPLVNMSEVPLGLRSRDFPRDLWDLEFSRCNLTALPPDLEFSWTSVTLLVFEWNKQVIEFPPVLARLPKLTSLLLSGNGIVHVPDRMLSRLELRQLNLKGNPLQALPIGIGLWRPNAFALFAGCNISDIPEDWRAAATKPIRLDATGTPLCDRLIASTDTPASDDVRVAIDGIPVLCQRGVFLLEPDYPLALEERQRRPQSNNG
ncbi:hypothetical protein PINS_up007061 [Pythium insidiosum]|nr:hypothetical protein PINS_up007061 [Pythium insidiosum]